MRTIEISTEVFARIWSQRIAGEENENAILMRLLGIKKEPVVSQSNKIAGTGAPHQSIARTSLWRQDVRRALEEIGGEAHLKEIYKAVRGIRRMSGSSVPVNLEAIVRRELEHNSSDAGSYQGKRDWFRSVGGIGSGIWALREEARI